MGFTSSFGFSVASLSSYDYATTPSKEVLCLASIFSGIILCLLDVGSLFGWFWNILVSDKGNIFGLTSLVIVGSLTSLPQILGHLWEGCWKSHIACLKSEVYRSTAVLSSMLFKGYGKLSRAEKIEWNNRGFSTFHALFVSSASFYLLILSDMFKENSHGDQVINRSSTLSNTVLGISLGYFLTDLAMIIWHFPALGGLEYVLHHGLSIFSIIIALLSGQVQIYILMVLFSESTTPFVNLRWYLDVAGLKNSKLYTGNGIALFFGWLVARILLFMFLFIHIWIHFDEVKEVFPLAFYSLLVVPPLLTVMNLFWFWKIAKGMVKTLTKAKHSK